MIKLTKALLESKYQQAREHIHDALVKQAEETGVTRHQAVMSNFGHLNTMSAIRTWRQADSVRVDTLIKLLTVYGLKIQIVKDEEAIHEPRVVPTVTGDV